MLSKRISNLKPSAVMALSAKAQQRKAEGADVISLTLGEPTWPTPQSICVAGKKAIDEGHTKYTPANGSLKIRESIATYTTKQIGVKYAPNQVTVSIGAKFILFSALQSLCDPGDEVLVPAPYWVSYPAMIELAEAKLKTLHCQPHHNFKLQPKDLNQQISSKSKILILNSPNNPSGAVFSGDELKALGEVLRAHPHIYILSDDIYNELCFSQAVAPHLLQVCPDLKDRTLCINAVSKNYSMPGWRVGWAVGKPELINAMSRFQSQSVSCTSSISQEATAWALSNCEKEVQETREFLTKTKALALQQFQNIENLDIFPPEGTFYLWVGVKKIFGKSCAKREITSSADFVEALFDAQSVLCTPGEAFGYPGYVRIHFAVDEKILLDACSRIQKFITALS